MKLHIHHLGFFFTILIGLVLSGCAPVITGSTEVDKSAFGAKKRFAVVSIQSPKTFRGEKGWGQMFKKDDEIRGMNTQPLIDALRPKIVGSLQKNKNFSLVPEKTLLSSAAYKNLAEDKREMKVLFSSEEINVAKNYKYISDPEKYAKLAKDLGLDGVIGITVALGVGRDQGGAIGYAGLALGAQSYSAMATVMAVAYDKNGKVIWKDITVKMADPSDTKAIFLVDTTKILDTNFEKFHPSAIEIGGKAIDILLARFDDAMAGKAVSSMQSFK